MSNVLFFLIQTELVSLPSFATIYPNGKVMRNGKEKSIKAGEEAQ